MPKVTFLPASQTIEFEAGGIPYQQEGRRESLLDVALNCGADLRHACGGICACITCHVIVERGDENLSPMEQDEEDRLYRIPNLTVHSRLACRAVVRGDVVARIPALNPSRDREGAVPNCGSEETARSQKTERISSPDDEDSA